jgi:hypothetical protein
LGKQNEQTMVLDEQDKKFKKQNTSKNKEQKNRENMTLDPDFKILLVAPL